MKIFIFLKTSQRTQCHSLAFCLVCLAYIPAALDSLDAYLVLVLTARRENTKHRKPKHKPSIQSDTSEHSSAIVTCLGCNLVVFLLYTLLCCNICPKRPTELLSVNMRKREGTSFSSAAPKHNQLSELPQTCLWVHGCSKTCFHFTKPDRIFEVRLPP